MDPLVITTQVDLTGANQLATGVVAAMQKVIVAQQAVKEQSAALRETQKALGQAAEQGNAQAAAAIQEELTRLAELRIQLEQAVDAYRAEKKAVEDAAKAHLEHASAALSERAAAAASLRVLEGGLQGSTRAASAFLATTLGLGPILQAAFPIIGAIALIEVLGRIPEAIDHIEDAIAGWNKQQEKAFKEAVGEADELLTAYAKFNKADIEQAISPTLSGTSKIEAEVGALGKYQGSLAAVQDQLNQLKAAADAANQSIKITPPGLGPRGTPLQPVQLPAFAAPTVDGEKVRSQVDSQLKSLNEMLREEAIKYKQPIPAPIEINWATSRDTVEKQLQEVIDGVRKEIRKLSESQEDVNLQIGGKKSTELSDQQKDEFAAGEARLAARRKTAEALIAVDEETQKHLLATGVITQAQEVAALALDTQKKLQIEIDYYHAVDALKAKRDTAERKAPGLDTSIIGNQSDIAALQSKQRADAMAAEDAASKASLKTQLEGIDEQIAATKAAGAAEINTTTNTTAAVVALEQQKVAAVAAVNGTRGEEYHHVLDELLNADREYAAASKKVLQQAVEAELKDVDRAIKEREKLIQDAARQEQAGLSVTVATQKAAAPEFEAPQQQASRLIADAQAVAAVEESIDQQVTASKIASLEQQKQAYEAAYFSGELNAREYGEKVQEIDNEITEAARDSAAKQLDVVSREKAQEIGIVADAAKKEADAVKQFADQSTNAFNGFLTTIITTTGTINGHVSEWAYMREQWNKVLLQMEQDFIRFALKVIEQSAIFNPLRDILSKLTGAGGGGIQGLGQVPNLNQLGAGVVNPVVTASSAAATQAQVAAQTTANAQKAALYQQDTTAYTAAQTQKTATTTTATGTQTGAVATGQTTQTGSVASAKAAQQALTVTQTGTVTGAQATQTGVVAGAQATQTGAVIAAKTTQLGVTASAAATGAAVDAAANTQTRLESAKTAATNTYASVSAIPIIGWILAPPAAAAAFAAALAFEEGGVVPYTGLHLVHEGERVLTVQQTAQYDNRITNLAGGGGGYSGSDFSGAETGAQGRGGDTYAGDHNTSTFHYHEGSVNALDATGASEVLKRHRTEIHKIVRQGIASGALKPRDLLR